MPGPSAGPQGRSRRDFNPHDEIPGLQIPLLGHSGASRSANLSEDVRELQRAISAAVQWSLVANILLLIAKTVALVVTGSMSVAASALDSLVDLGMCSNLLFLVANFGALVNSFCFALAPDILSNTIWNSEIFSIASAKDIQNSFFALFLQLPRAL